MAATRAGCFTYEIPIWRPCPPSRFYMATCSRYRSDPPFLKQCLRDEYTQPWTRPEQLRVGRKPIGETAPCLEGRADFAVPRIVRTRYVGECAGWRQRRALCKA